MIFTEKQIKKFLKKNCNVDSNGCWLWLGNTYSNGYGRLSSSEKKIITKRTSRVHILAFSVWRGAIPEGKLVCHTCDVKRCFNPAHLWLGTNKENQDDAVRKGMTERVWPSERRERWRKRFSGSGNNMYGKRGVLAPAFGRTGEKHPMYGKRHSEESKRKISEGLKRAKLEGRR